MFLISCFCISLYYLVFPEITSVTGVGGYVAKKYEISHYFGKIIDNYFIVKRGNVIKGHLHFINNVTKGDLTE